MSEDIHNLDPWSRLRHHIGVLKDKAADEILGGSCTPDTYHRLCGGYAACIDILDLMEETGRGQDVRPPRPGPVFNPRSIEDC